jgi:hypothetical protein
LNMGKFGLSSYSLALSLSNREDVIAYYSDCLGETKKLHNDAKETAAKKGIVIRPPVIPRHEKVDFVKAQSFLAGYFGKEHYNKVKGRSDGSFILIAQRKEH